MLSAPLKSIVNLTITFDKESKLFHKSRNRVSQARPCAFWPIPLSYSPLFF
jgi:hypothetical protein